MKANRGRVAFATALALLVASGVSHAWKEGEGDEASANAARQKVGEDYSQMIDGKAYKVVPGDEAGTFKVTWGDESVVWKPREYHPPSYKKLGPAVYDRWIQPNLPYPWDKPLTARLQQDGREIHDRSYTALYFNEFGENYLTYWAIDLTSPDGTPRNKKLYEWLVAYRQNKEGLPPDLVDKVRANYMFVFVAPDDFRGLGISTTIYQGDKFNDEFLYTPSSRKVRRLPQAARQDIIPGTIARWEDFPQVKPFPDIEYKVVGTTLYKGQEDGTFGFTTKTEAEKVGVGMDGVGEPAWILELTPTQSGYWYAKQKRIIGMKTGSSWYEEVFDSQGEITRRRVNRRSIANEDPRLKNPSEDLEDWQMMWGQEYFWEPKTGFSMAWYMIDYWINYDKMPRDVVNLENLLKEPVRKILFWE